MNPKKRPMSSSNSTGYPKKIPMSSSNSTGYRGVYRISARFRAKIYFDGKINDLGTFATAKEAGLAYDHAITHHCLTRKLNFPDGLPLDDEDYEELMHPDKKNRLKSDKSRYDKLHRQRYTRTLASFFLFLFGAHPPVFSLCVVCHSFAMTFVVFVVYVCLC
jgi:hypothetical protein